MVNLIVSGKNGDRMKTLKLHKDISYGIALAQDIKMANTKDDMKIIRCILGKDEKNVVAVINFLDLMPPEWNKAIRLGMYLELSK